MGDINNVSWPGWETVRKIGSGSFGTVFEIQRKVSQKIEKAALKVIVIPQNSSDIEELYGEGYDSASISCRYEGYKEELLQEYSLMADMKGHANIVYCDDFYCQQHEDGLGWTFYIKMELLTPLMKVPVSSITEKDIVSLGIDMCTALVFCKERNIVHRDIKPQNIFVSKDGKYKLGDFGVAKTVERTVGGTKIGTYKYMAPEVYKSLPYGSQADIYSLGLVLYWLLNERRSPFVPLPPHMPTPLEENEAHNRRFTGDAIPTPKHGSDRLKAIVLRACAYTPSERYDSAEEMLEDLLRLKHEIEHQDMMAQKENEHEHFASMNEKKVKTEDVIAEDIKEEPEIDLSEDEATVSAWKQSSAQKKTAAQEVVLMTQEEEPESELDKTASVFGVHDEKPSVKHNKSASNSKDEKVLKEDTARFDQKESEEESAISEEKRAKLNYRIVGYIAAGLVALVVCYFVFLMPRNEWVEKDGATYYYDGEGKKVTRIQEIDGVRYGFSVSGILERDKWIYIDYYSDRNGVIVTGWRILENYYNGDKYTGMYYFDPDSGKRVTGWQTIGGEQYYFSEDKNNKGIMLTGWHSIDDIAYYFDEQGVYRAHLEGSGEDRRCVTPEGTEYAKWQVYLNCRTDGSGEDRFKYTTDDGRRYEAGYRILKEPIKNCVSFVATLEQVSYETLMAGNWKVYVRDFDGEWLLAGALAVTDSQTEGTLLCEFEVPVSFDAFVFASNSDGSGRIAITLTSIRVLEILEE